MNKNKKNKTLQPHTFYLYFSKLKNQACKIESVYILGAIQTCLRQLFGEIDGSVEIELLSLKKNQRISLKVPVGDAKKVRVALTFLHNFGENPCYFKTISTSAIPIKEID